MLFMAVTHTYARMLKRKNLPSTPSQNRNSLEIMHDPNYTEMPNATHAKCNYSRLGYSKMAYEMLQLSCIQL